MIESMMESDQFYRAFTPELCQGDIFERVPHLLLKEHPQSLRPTTLPGNRVVYELHTTTEDEPAPSAVQDLAVPATCQMTRAILLTFDCEIDKDKKHRTVALVRPLPADLAASDRLTIQQNRRFAFFHLPASGEMLPESYVDFRRICTLSPIVVDGAKRLSALSPTARQALLMQFFRFFS